MNASGRKRWAWLSLLTIRIAFLNWDCMSVRLSRKRTVGILWFSLQGKESPIGERRIYWWWFSWFCLLWQRAGVLFYSDNRRGVRFADFPFLVWRSLWKAYLVRRSKIQMYRDWIPYFYWASYIAWVWWWHRCLQPVFGFCLLPYRRCRRGLEVSDWAWQFLFYRPHAMCGYKRNCCF